MADKMVELFLTREELVKEIRKPGRVYVWANLSQEDGFYVEAVKTDLIRTFTDSKWFDVPVVFECHRRDIGLFI